MLEDVVTIDMIKVMILVLTMGAGTLILIHLSPRDVRKGWFKPVIIDGRLEINKKEYEALKRGSIIRKETKLGLLEIFVDPDASLEDFTEDDLMITILNTRIKR